MLGKQHEKWTFRIFFIFLCWGRGKGESEAPVGGGVGFLLKILEGGGGAGRGGAERPGPEGVCGELENFRRELEGVSHRG